MDFPSALIRRVLFVSNGLFEKTGEAVLAAPSALFCGRFYRRQSRWEHVAGVTLNNFLVPLRP